MPRPEPGGTFAVMYHYVRPAEESGLNYLDLDDFRLQLDFLSTTFGLLGSDDWNALKDGELRPGVFLTFDDGLADGFQYVLPELEKRGIEGQFYVCSEPLVEAKLLPVHVTHMLLRELEAAEILDNLRKLVGSHNLIPLDDSISRSAYHRHDDEASKKLVKKVINYGYRQEKWREPLCHLVENLLGSSEAQASNSWYISADSVRLIAQQGHVVGSHTCSHKLLSRLDSDDIRKELRFSKSVLEDLTSDTVEDFCFPYGGAESYNRQVLDELARSKYRASFSVESRTISANDLRAMYELPRFDCSEVLHWMTQ